jgi:hypothetical protein
MMEGAAQKGIALRDADKQQQVTSGGRKSMAARACRQLRHRDYIIAALPLPLGYHPPIVIFASAAVIISLIVAQLAASVNAILESSYRTAAAQASSPLLLL